MAFPLIIAAVRVPAFTIARLLARSGRLAATGFRRGSAFGRRGFRGSRRAAKNTGNPSRVRQVGQLLDPTDDILRLFARDPDADKLFREQMAELLPEAEIELHKQLQAAARKMYAEQSGDGTPQSWAIGDFFHELEQAQIKPDILIDE